MKTTSPSAVAVIETSGVFLTEGRPDIPGELAHSGKVQLFGGHIDDGETPGQTICRELQEELRLSLPEEPPLVWDGVVESQNRHGEPAWRHVYLFYVRLTSVGRLAMRVPGEIVAIPKTPEDVEQHKDRLTRFAYDSLKKALESEFSVGSIEPA